MAEYLGYRGGLDYAQFGDTVYIWARKTWHKFCSAVEWFSTWPGQRIRKVWYAGIKITLKRH